MDDKTFWTFLYGFVIGGIVIGLFLGQVNYGDYATTRLPRKFYANTGEWEIVKDERGRTKGVRVKREAEEG